MIFLLTIVSFPNFFLFVKINNNAMRSWGSSGVIEHIPNPGGRSRHRTSTTKMSQNFRKEQKSWNVHRRGITIWKNYERLFFIDEPGCWDLYKPNKQLWERAHRLTIATSSGILPISATGSDTYGPPKQRQATGTVTPRWTDLEAAELYDYETDPDGTENRADDPKLSSVRETLSSKLKEHFVWSTYILI